MKKIFFLILIIFLAGFFLWEGIYFPKTSNLSEGKFFVIEKGQSLFQIAQNLEKEGLIKNRFFFNFYVILKGKEKKLQSGEYFFNSSLNIAQIAQKIILGDVAKEILTIPEGWDLKDISSYFEEKGIYTTEEFLKITNNDFSEDFDFLKDKPKNLNLEGYLFPDTYEVNRGGSLEELIRKMLDNFDKKMTGDLRTEIQKQEKTIFEIITTASLLEKEVKTLEDKKIVSGILWKRLKNKMPLQIDATISYITGKNTTGISVEDTKIDSPYNTYKYRGLPLGPICSPGLESITAAIYPKDSDYWYYLSTPEGKTIFSKTYQEHIIAKEKYLK